MRPPIANDRVSGINCPNCGQFIPTSITELLTSNCLICPVCSLKLTIDKQESKTALEALRKVDIAQKQVQETEKFSR